MERVRCADCGTWVREEFTHEVGGETLCVLCALEFQKGLEELMEEIEDDI